jgi:hypothetical protein
MRSVSASSRRTPFVLVALLSLWMLFSPASTVPAGPPYSDKAVHILLFAALAATGRHAGMHAGVLAGVLVGYAIGSEVLQSVLPINRTGDVVDAAVDVLGVVVGLLVWRWQQARSSS